MGGKSSIFLFDGDIGGAELDNNAIIGIVIGSIVCILCVIMFIVIGNQRSRNSPELHEMPIISPAESELKPGELYKIRPSISIPSPDPNTNLYNYTLVHRNKNNAIDKTSFKMDGDTGRVVYSGINFDDLNKFLDWTGVKKV